MNILFTSTLLPPVAGGAEQILWELAKRLATKKDLTIHILTTGKYGTEIKDGVVIHRVPYLPYVYLPLLFYSTIGKIFIDKLIGKEKFDIIHFHMPLPWGFVLRNYPGKKIVTFHGDETGCLEKNKLLRFIQKFFITQIITKVKFIVSPSKYYLKEIKRTYNKKCIVIENNIDTNLFTPLDVAPFKKTILFVGRYRIFKGFLDLINVAKELPQYEFLFVGKGKLEHMINLSNTKNLGLMIQEELAQIYNKATICVFPSHNESFGVAALEAMACGKPVIATNCGFSEFIDNNENGLIIEKQNKVQLKEVIIKLMENEKLREKLGKNARKKALNYDWDNAIDMYYELYNKLIVNK